MVVAFDVETTKAPRHFPWVDGSYLVSLSLARDDGVVRSWLFNHPESDKPHGISIKEIQDEFAKAKRLVAHNSKFDLLWLLSLGVPIMPYTVYCTAVAEYLLRGQQVQRGELTLEELSRHYGISDKIDIVKSFWESGYETDEISAKTLTTYGEQDSINALAIHQRQASRLVSMLPLATLQMEMTKVLAQIEYNGMLVDSILVSKYQQEYGERLAAIDTEVISILEEEAGIHPTSFNMASRDDISAALFGGICKYDSVETVEKPKKDGSVRVYERKCIVEYQVKGLGFKPEQETAKEGVYKTDADTLLNLKCKTPAQKRFISLMQERSKLAKLKSTYFDGIAERLDATKRVHPSLNQTIAKTGRLTSSNPNGQNMPRGSTGPVKQIFISRY